MRSKAERAEAAPFGDRGGEVGSREAAAHSGLTDRNIEAESIKQVHARAGLEVADWRMRRGDVPPSRRAPRNHAVRGVHGQFGVIVCRCYLDHVHADNIVLVAQLTNHAEEVGARDATGLRRPGSRGVRGIHHVDIHRHVELFGLRQRLADRVAHDVFEAASQISCMVCHTMPCSSIHSKVSCGGQYPRSPTWTKWVPGTAPDSISRRIGVPWLARFPSMMSAVSACASKCTMPTLP